MGIVKRIGERVWKYLSDADYRFLFHASRFHAADRLPDEDYLRRMFQASMGQTLDLADPRTFNEKLQWLKLHDRRPVYTVMVDKYKAKEWVAAHVGEQYVIPTLGVWERPEEIDFDALPEQFVLKCNHNSGLGMYLCRDKSRLSPRQVRKDLQKGLEENFYMVGREWPYRDVPRRILAEPYLSDDGGAGLTDYKVHVFGGVPKCILVCKDRFAPGGLTEDFFTPDWQLMPPGRPGISRAADAISPPERLEEMLSLAATLARDIPFLRVDFYQVKGQLYVSELTFFPASGFKSFDPPQWDDTFGTWLELPRVDI